MADKDSTQQSEAMEQRAKSIFHTMMFDATADWLQSYTTSSSSGSDKSSEGKSTSPKKQDDVPRAEQILSPESSFDAPFVDDSDGDDDGYDNHTEKMQARGNTESFATAEEPKTTIREFDKADEPTNYVKVDEVEATDDQRDASDHLQAETSKSSRGESLVSMNSTSSSSSSSLQEKMGNNDVDSYGFSVEGDQSDLESDVSIASMEDEQEGLSNNPSFDSFETMQSELPPMISQAKVEIEPKADLQASWAAISASSSSSSSASSMEATADIFIRDKMYSWLPAKVLEHTHEYALVAIDLPDSWIDSTVMEKGDNFSMGYLHPSMKAIPTHEVNRLTNEFGVPSFQLRRVFFKEYEQGHLPLQNMQSEAKRDMADLMELHPAAILYNLKDRHYLHKPYTRVGDIVIAMNPCTWIKELYEPATREMYSKNLIWEAHQEMETKASDLTERKNIYDKLGFDPHVYEVSALAYRSLATTGQDQTILVTGESGAGKTETVKIVMDHLATVQQTRPEGVPSEHSAAAEIVARVCKSSPVFEAFGNAKTVRNDNSSRFGKFIQLQFEVEPMAVAELAGRAVPFTDLVGSNCTTYLLEKNRVVFHAEGERTFHIFYQLLGAPKEFKENIGSFWADATGHDFCYTAGHGCNNAEDAEAWQETVEALEVFKFQGDSLRVLMESLAIVLQLGNLVFDHDPSDFEEHNTIIKNKEELQRLSELSGIDSKDIEETMTSRVLKTPGSDDIKVKLSPQVAKESCDALAKEIYSRIFGLMVRRINEYTACPEPRRLGAKGFGHISLLDIFGFERFDVNRFEQLCINYTNERLHNKYVVDNFNQIKDEYHTEGVDLYDFKLVDNSKILDLLEGNPGLIISLNEECFLPKGNSESFVYKVKSTHSESKRLIDKKLHRKTEFGIDHFTGPVEYEAMNFVERNMDKLPDGLLECAAKSTNSFIQEEFKIMLSTRGLDGLDEGKGSFKKKKSSNKTVLQKFQTQLKSLMSVMEGTRTRYIRCIKPNTAMAPKLTNHNSTMQQLECSGLMTALIISRESFPTKLPYEFIMSRYSCLMMEKDFKYIGKMDLKSKVNHILSKWLKPLSKKCRGGTRTMPFACGKTKVFFKAGAQDRLEELRMEYFERAALTVQTWARKHGAMQMLTRAKKSACKMQSLYRMVKVRVRFQQTKRAATFIAALGRRILAVAHFVMAKRSACKLQSFSRMVVARAQLQRQRRAATVLAAWIRGRFAVAQLVSAVRSARKLQSFSRMVVARAQFQHQKWAQTVMAAWIRGRWAVALLVQMRKERAATLIQSYCRSRPARQELSRKLDAMAVIQRAARSRASAVTESEKDTKIADVSSEARVVGSKTKMVQTGVRDEASVELNAGIKEMLGNLRSEVASLRADNNELQDTLQSTEEQSRANTAVAVDAQEMLASLRSEVASLRENNYEMQLKLQFKDEALQGLAAKLEDSDESSSFQSRMQDLTKANDALVKEVFKYRNDSGKMKRDSQSKNLQASAKLSALAEELNRVQKLRETETKDLKDTIRLNQKLIEEERSSLKREVSLVQEKYSVDVKKLKQELSSAQTSHQEYLTKIMNVLEDTHKMREEETEKISAELRAVKEEKDNEILMLQQEVKALRVKRGGMKVKKEIRAAVDSRAIRKQLEYESDSRGRRSAQFDDIVQDLQSLVAESNALPADVEVYDLEEMAAQQERGQKMSEMVDLLNDLYRLEEDSQDKISQESLTLVEEYVGVTEPHRTVHSLRDKLANLEFENSRLLEELREKAGCKRCAVRDSAARRRIHGSATSNEPLSIES